MQVINSFIKNSAVLAFSSVIVKIIGAGYRIVLTRFIGAEGIGLYSTIFNIFMPFFSVVTAGITPTISRFTAQLREQKNPQAVCHLKKISTSLYMALGGVGCLISIFAGYICSIKMQQNVIFIGTLILAPSIMFAAGEAIYKGISQGKMDMVVTAKANILECFAKTIIGLALIYFCIYIWHTDTDTQVTASVTAILISAVLCWGYLWINYRGQAKNSIVKSGITVKQLLSVSVPVSMSALTISGINFFDTVICLSFIEKIPAEELFNSFGKVFLDNVNDVPVYLFGIYQGMVLSIFNLISSLSSTIGVSSLPIITKSRIKGDTAALQRQASRLFRFTAVVNVPICIYIFFFANDIIDILFGFGTQQSSLAAQMLKTIILSGIFLAFSFPMNSVLHAFNCSKDILKILLFSGTAKVVASYLLCRIPKVNINGCIYSSVLFYLLVFVLTSIKINKLGIKFSCIKTLTIPIMLSFVLATAALVMQQEFLYMLPKIFSICITGAFYCFIYALLMLLTGFLVDNDSQKVV